MTYFAAALTRDGKKWTGEEFDLDEVEDLDDVVEQLRSVAGDESDAAVLFVEEDDEWFGVLRLDGDGEPRVFVSDARAVGSSGRAALLAEAALETTIDDDEYDDDEVDVEDDGEEEGTSTDIEPLGDTTLLGDLGTPPRRLLDLCAEEGQLPADVITEICASAGCLDVMERLRGE